MREMKWQIGVNMKKWKNLWMKVLLGIIGLALLAAVILTAERGLADEDIACYEMALSLQEDLGNIGFSDFQITDYPIAFNDGTQDYVLLWGNTSYEIITRKPVIDALAATAFNHDGGYEVLVPTKRRMSELIGLMGGRYDSVEQVATLWHEAFHCWQFTNYEAEILALIGGHDFTDEDYGESLIVEVCDRNAQAVALWNQQSELLAAALAEGELSKIREGMVQYKELEEARNAMLPESVYGLESYYLTVEGTAQYLEARAFRLLQEDGFEERYGSGFLQYVDGSGKYYSRGMAQCFLLDKLDGDWKGHYDFSVPPASLIYEELGI